MSLYNEEELVRWIDTRDRDIYGRWIFGTDTIDIWAGIYDSPEKKLRVSKGISAGNIDYVQILIDNVRIKIYIRDLELTTAIYDVVVRITSDLPVDDSTKEKTQTFFRELSTNLSCVDF